MLEGSSPMLKLCSSLTSATLESPSGLNNKICEPMSEGTPIRRPRTSKEITSPIHIQNQRKEFCDTCVDSSDVKQRLCDTPCQSPCISSKVSDQFSSDLSPLCVPLHSPFEGGSSSTPRRNHRISRVDKANSRELTGTKLKQVHRSSISKGKASKRIPGAKVNGSIKDVVPVTTSFIKSNVMSQNIFNLSSNDSPKESHVIESNVVSSVSSDLKLSWFQNNNILNNVISSEPRNLRKSDTGYLSSRRLSFSAKKTVKKNDVADYDPDNDVFAQGLMPVRFNFDSVKKKIGELLNTSDSLSPQLQKSRSCGTLNDKVPVSCDSPVSSRKKPSKQSSSSLSRNRVKRTASAPDLHETVKLDEMNQPKVATEETIRAFLRARDIIKNIKQRATNYCNVSSLLGKSVLNSNSSAVNNQISGESASSSSNAITENFESARRSTQDDSLNNSMDNSFDDTDLPPTQPFESLILKGVTAYVEVISNNENISAGVRSALVKLGANVVISFTKDVPVTHVVFNNGHISTYKKAKKRNIPLVSVLWIEACRKAGLKVHESHFPPSQIERYESPSIVKELKKRRILHFHSDEKPRHSPRRKKNPPQIQSSVPSSKLPRAKSTEKKARQTPEWVDEVAGDNGMVRLLVNMTGINHNEFKDLVNRPPTPDSDLEPGDSPLPVRLLRKLVKSSVKSSDSTRKDTSECSSHVKNISENVMSKKIHHSENNHMSDVNDEPETTGKGISEKCEFESTKLTSLCSSQNASKSDESHLQNVSQRKKTVKRKLLSPSEESVTVVNDVSDVENTTVENPHKTPKRDVRNSVKEIKLDSFSEVPSEDILDSNLVTEKHEACEGNRDCPNTDQVRRSRRSSAYFVKPIKKWNSPIVEKPGLVCTLLHSEDLDLVASIVETVGTFVLEKNVTSLTTHIVTGASKRTMKVLKGMARGCWIVTREWVLKSLEARKWLDEEEFELTSFSPAVQKYRLEKLSFGGIFKPDIFSSCGSIFVSSHSKAPRGDLVELILLCGGRVASRVSNAEVVVGKYYPNVVCISELWVLDSIQYYCCKPFDSYVIYS